MNCAIMGNIDGNLTRICFDPANVRQILHVKSADVVQSHDRETLFLKVGEEVCKVENSNEAYEVGPYFIVLDSLKAFSVRDYQVLFNIRELPDGLISGVDVTGKEHLCRWYGSNGSGTEDDTCSVEQLTDKIEKGTISEKELEDLKEVVKKLRAGEFYEALTVELSGKIKEIAKELIEFRKDLQKKIEPNIVDLASKDIPEASDQLEGINETLEKSTMKIMDINDELLEISNEHAQAIKAFLEQMDGPGSQDGANERIFELQKCIGELKEFLSGQSGEYSELVDLFMPVIEKAEKELSSGDGTENGTENWRESIKVLLDNIRLLSEEDENSETIARLSNFATEIERLLSTDGISDNTATIDILKDQIKSFEKINKLSMDMLEPLSFQDLVGQRIQRIIRLVKSMERRIEDLVFSFGVTLQKHREDPDRSYEEVIEEVEEFRSELKGPQREGEGLDQAAIDELLDSL